MRVAVVVFARRKRGLMTDLAGSLVQGMEQQGFTADIIDGIKEPEKKLTSYQYIAVGTETEGSFGGRILPAVSVYLKQSGLLTGKKSFGFVIRPFIGAQSALKNLMAIMEGEALRVKYSYAFKSAPEAYVIGSRLHIS